MKILIQLLFLLQIFSNQQLLGQSLVQQNNQWNIIVYPTDSPGTSTYSLKIDEEQNIDGITYNKVIISTDSLNNNWTFSGDFLRQDSTKKVFYKEEGFEEILIYDFNLELNDTFYTDFNCVAVVTSIDTIQINNGDLRKRWKLESPDFGVSAEYWIEEIGSTRGMISYYFNFCATDYPDDLLCFFSDEILLYPSAPASCFITSNENQDIKPVEIFPNPFSSLVSLHLNGNSIKNYIIYNLNGRIVKQGNIVEDSILNLKILPDGAYIIAFFDEKGVLFSRKKLMKNNNSR